MGDFILVLIYFTFWVAGAPASETVWWRWWCVCIIYKVSKEKPFIFSLLIPKTSSNKAWLFSPESTKLHFKRAKSERSIKKIRARNCLKLVCSLKKKKIYFSIFSFTILRWIDNSSSPFQDELQGPLSATLWPKLFFLKERSNSIVDFLYKGNWNNA